MYLTPYDLFRFEDDGPYDPSNLAEFATMPRFLDTGGTAIFDLISPPHGPAEYGLSTGFFAGDGNQASHWKEESLYGSYIGVMDPGLAAGRVARETYADLAALDVMGWDITYSHVPDSAGAGSLLMSLGALGIFQWRARRKA